MRYWLACAMVLVAAAMALAVEPGEKAPPLKVAKWVVGEQVNPDQPDGKTIYVIDFWATWSPVCLRTVPFLVKLQDKYKDRLVVVGISDEETSAVEEFARRLRITYAIGVDNKRMTSKAYLGGIRTRPYSFVVDSKGEVLWAGHPMRGLEYVVEQVLTGNFDPERIKNIEQARERLAQASRAGNLDAVLAALDELIKLDPTEYEYVSMKVETLRNKGDTEGILQTRRAAAQAFAKTPISLNNLAWEIVTDSDIATRDPMLGLTCAQEAVRLNDRKDHASLDTLARAYFSICMLDEAIATQKEALAACKDDEEREPLNAAMRYYEQVKIVQELVREAREAKDAKKAK